MLTDQRDLLDVLKFERYFLGQDGYDDPLWPLGECASFSKIRPPALITRRRKTELLVALAC
jgi:hypothetical protein